MAKGGQGTVSSMNVLDGPRIPPLSGKQATSLVVFLHGYGADGNDLIDIGRMWAPLLPGTAFVSPHAPQPCDEAPMGRQWFPLSGMDPRAMRQGKASTAAKFSHRRATMRR